MIRLPVLAGVKGGVFLALRLALSAVVGTLVALFVSLILYGKDIGGQLAAEHAARNAATTRRVDDRIARNASSLTDLRARIAAADRAAEGLRRGLAERADPATAAAAAELARAERERERAGAEIARLRRRVDGGNATGGPKAGASPGGKPLVATPGRKEARAVQRDLPQWAVDQLMARQDRATALPGTGMAQPHGPARVMSTDWVAQDRQARLAQAAARPVAGQPMPAPGGTVPQGGPTLSEAQAIEAMRARFAKAWGLVTEPDTLTGVETRDGRLRAWTAELPARARGKDEEREP